MKKILVLAVVVLVFGARAHAQTGVLEVFGDRAATSCVLVHTPFIESVYVFQTGGTPTRGVQGFKAAKPACWTATYIGDQVSPSASKLGTSQTSLAVVFPVCLPLPVLLVEIQYLAGGTSTPCCQYQVVASGALYADCLSFELPVIAGPRRVAINPDLSCPCGGTVATESTTWGRVKSLYR